MGAGGGGGGGTEGGAAGDCHVAGRAFGCPHSGPVFGSLGVDRDRGVTLVEARLEGLGTLLRRGVISQCEHDAQRAAVIAAL